MSNDAPRFHTTAPRRELLTLLARRDDLTDAGTPPPCDSDPAWISDHRATLHDAAARCTPCPLLTLCRAAGQHEISGVWGGWIADPRLRKAPRR